MSIREGVRFGVLGPLQVLVGARAVEIVGAKQRALLAALLLQHDHVVAADRLLELLWGTEPPGSALKALHVHISRLRRALATPGLLETRAPGYLIHVPADGLDLDRFRRLSAEGRAAAARGQPDAARRALNDALSIWRGPALADVAGAGLLVDAATLLDDERLACLEDRIAADLALKRHSEVIPELERLVTSHPLRERLQAQLMLALNATGRQSEALARFQDARRILVTELGLEPGRQLRDLEQAILRQDPTLPMSPVVRPVTDRRTHRPRRVTALAGVAALAAAAVVLAVGPQDQPALSGATVAAPQPDTGPNRLVAIDPGTNKAVFSTPVGEGPGSITAAHGAIWVANAVDRTVSRLDVRTRQVRTVGGVPVAQQVASTRDGDVWLSSFEEPLVTRIADNGVVLDNEASPWHRVRLPGSAEGLAVGGGFLWVTSPSDSGGKDQVFQIDLRSDDLVRSINVGTLPLFITFGYGSAWVSCYDDGSVSVIRPGSKHPERVPVAAGPLGLAVGAGAVWVVSYWTQELSRIDPDTREVVGRISVGEGPLSVAAGAGAVWVTNREDHSVTRVDPVTNQVVKTIELDSSPQAITVFDGRVWVTTQH